jgi:ABC-type sugar transport system, permease component
MDRFQLSPLWSLDAWKKRLWIVIRAALLIGLSFIILYPILVRISTAFKHRADIYDPLVVWLPRTFTWDNFRVAMQIMDYVPTLSKTLLLVSLTTVLQVVSCALAGYAFAKLRFRGSGLLFAAVILTILVPPQTIMLPLYLNFKNFDLLGLYSLFTGDGMPLLNSWWPFILTAATANSLKSGLYIFIFRQFFRGLPKEIEEASFVDGAGVFRTFYAIMMPNAIPAAVTVLLFAFVWMWNDSLFTSIYMPSGQIMSSELTQLPNNVKVYLETEGFEPFYASMLSDTGVLLAIIPLIILYLVFQRYFVESIERSGLVG